MTIINIAKEYIIMSIIVWATFTCAGIVKIFDYISTPKLILDIVILLIDVVLLIKSIIELKHVNEYQKGFDKFVKEQLKKGL